MKKTEKYHSFVLITTVNSSHNLDHEQHDFFVSGKDDNNSTLCPEDALYAQPVCSFHSTVMQRDCCNHPLWRCLVALK